VRFECRLDGGGWKTCTSPRRLRILKLGRHRFGVRALARSSAKLDLTPATATWTVRRKR
jgi:hypothetical protein